MQEFKDYIRQNRDELDIETPPSYPAWNVKPAARVPLKIGIRWAVAASTLLVLSTVIYWGMKISNGDINPTAKINNGIEESKPQNDSLKSAASLPDRHSEKGKDEVVTRKQDKLTQELVKQPVKTVSRVKSKTKTNSSSPLSLETNYTQVINHQLKQLEQTPIYAESADYFHVFKKQWYDMEKDEEKIREDIQIIGLNDILVDQFIQLYQQKISLLKQLRTEINNMNLKARNNPGFQKQSPTYFKM